MGRFKILLRTLRREMRTRYYTWRALSVVGNVRGPVFCNFRCVFTENTHLGVNVHFNGMLIEGVGEVYIGSNFHSGKNCKIITSYHNYRTGEKLPYDETLVVRKTSIGDNVWLGHDVTIVGGVDIGEGAVIQVGAVVTSSLPPLAVAGGNPARVFAWRDAARYYELKKKGCFH